LFTPHDIITGCKHQLRRHQQASTRITE